MTIDKCFNKKYYIFVIRNSHNKQQMNIGGKMNKESDIISFENIMKAFKEALQIPSIKDVEKLNERLDSIENLFLKQPIALKQPVEEQSIHEKTQLIQEKIEEQTQQTTEKIAIKEEKDEKPLIRKKKKGTKKEIKKAKTITATEEVFSVIKSCTKGANFKKIKETTQYEDKRIRNIVFRLEKLGKIKRVKRGVYKKV